MASFTKVRSSTALAALVAAAACAAGLKYTHDFDPAANLTAYRTYIWATPAEANSRGVNPLVERRIIAALDQQLQAKGYQLSTTGEADFAVNFLLTTNQQTDYSTYYTGMGYRGAWYGGMGSSTTRAYTTTNGTLIVDIFDVRSRELVWRGTAAGTVEENASQEQRDMRIQEAAAGILGPFPRRP
jgi:hypothetical protein